MFCHCAGYGLKPQIWESCEWPIRTKLTFFKLEFWGLSTTLRLFRSVERCKLCVTDQDLTYVFWNKNFRAFQRNQDCFYRLKGVVTAHKCVRQTDRRTKLVQHKDDLFFPQKGIRIEENAAFFTEQFSNSLWPSATANCHVCNIRKTKLFMEQFTRKVHSHAESSNRR